MPKRNFSRIKNVIQSVLNSRFGGLYVIASVFLSVWFILRTVLCIWSGAEHDLSLFVLCKTFLTGSLFDLVTCSYMIAPIAIILALMPSASIKGRFNRVWSKVFYFILLSFLFFEIAAELFFWDEFSTRFNFIAVDYLVYTQEVISNIWQSYSMTPIFLAIVAASMTAFMGTVKSYSRSLSDATTSRQRFVTAAVFLVIPVVSFLCCNISLANISDNQYSDELAKNGVYGFVEAFDHNIIRFKKFYISKDDHAVFTRIKQILKTNNSEYTTNDPFDITRQINYDSPEQRHNIVIIVVESLSAEYLGTFGNTEGLTPNLDELSRSSLLFRNCYATGTRTTRGLEAIVLSLPPTPGQSVVKRENNGNMFSIGTVFANSGYENKFIYGGRGFFDNMNHFFEKNGFETIDQTDFKRSEITFKNAWGVCDEDLYNKVLNECDKSYQNGKLFCSVVLTTSNHRPYTYPQSIDIPSGTGRNGAVKYTDHAFGMLFSEARQKAWFENTIFIIVADHCSGSAGKVEVPIDKYHIPIIMYAPKIIQPAYVDKLCSQIDLVPTLLGLLKFSYKSKFFGHDILCHSDERALLGNYQKIGFYQSGNLTLLLPKKQVSTYRFKDGEQLVADVNSNDLFDTIAYYQSADYLLAHNLLKNN